MCNFIDTSELILKLALLFNGKKKHSKLIMIIQQNVYKRTFVHCVWNNSQRMRCVNIINLIITEGEILQSTHNRVSI